MEFFCITSGIPFSAKNAAIIFDKEYLQLLDKKEKDEEDMYENEDKNEAYSICDFFEEKEFKEMLHKWERLDTEIEAKKHLEKKIVKKEATKERKIFLKEMTELTKNLLNFTISGTLCRPTISHFRKQRNELFKELSTITSKFNNFFVEQLDANENEIKIYPRRPKNEIKGKTFIDDDTSLESILGMNFVLLIRRLRRNKFNLEKKRLQASLEIQLLVKTFGIELLKAISDIFPGRKLNRFKRTKSQETVIKIFFKKDIQNIHEIFGNSRPFPPEDDFEIYGHSLIPPEHEPKPKPEQEPKQDNKPKK